MRYFKKVRKMETYYKGTRSYCDLCNNEIKGKSFFDVDDCSVEKRTGTSYPDGSFIDIKSIDICSECMEEKIIPLIEKEFNVKFKEYSEEDNTEELIDKGIYKIED